MNAIWSAGRRSAVAQIEQWLMTHRA